MNYNLDDNGSPSWLRNKLGITLWWFLGMNTLVAVAHLLVQRLPTEALFQYGFLTFFFGGLSIILGSKIGQKIVENQKDIAFNGGKNNPVQ